MNLVIRISDFVCHRNEELILVNDYVRSLVPSVRVTPNNAVHIEIFEAVFYR